MGSYDGIIGLDWLGKYSPMITHWDQGWIAIPKGGQLVVLQGEGDLCTHSLIELSLIREAAASEPQTIPPEVQALLEKFAHVFASPTGLPPRRQYDHYIPLVSGARPISM